MLFGFAPWIVYWVLVGNVPFTFAVVVALWIAVAAFFLGSGLGKPGRTLEIGAIATFAVLTVLTFTLSDSFMQRWIQPLGNAGIFLVALISLLIGKPFVREFAAAEQPPDVVKTELFGRIARVSDLGLDRGVRRHDGVVGDPADGAAVMPRSWTRRPRCRSSVTG